MNIRSRGLVEQPQESFEHVAFGGLFEQRCVSLSMGSVTSTTSDPCAYLSSSLNGAVDHLSVVGGLQRASGGAERPRSTSHRVNHGTWLPLVRVVCSIISFDTTAAERLVQLLQLRRIINVFWLIKPKVARRHGRLLNRLRSDRRYMKN